MTGTTEQRTDMTTQPRNTPARIGFWSAACGLGVIASIFLTPMLWLAYGSLYTFFMFMFGGVAIPAGHLGRRRGRALDGHDRGIALFAIVTGWLLIFISLLIVLVYFGAVVGLSLLTDSAA